MKKYIIIAITTFILLLPIVGNNNIQTQVYASKDKLKCDEDIDCYNDEGTEKVCPSGYHFGEGGSKCIKDGTVEDDGDDCFAGGSCHAPKKHHNNDETSDEDNEPLDEDDNNIKDETPTYNGSPRYDGNAPPYSGSAYFPELLKPLNHFGTFVTWSNWNISKLGPSSDMFRVFPNMTKGTCPQYFYNANTVVRDPYWDMRDFPNC